MMIMTMIELYYVKDLPFKNNTALIFGVMRTLGIVMMMVITTAKGKKPMMHIAYSNPILAK